MRENQENFPRHFLASVHQDALGRALHAVQRMDPPAVDEGTLATDVLLNIVWVFLLFGLIKPCHLVCVPGLKLYFVGVALTAVWG